MPTQNNIDMYMYTYILDIIIHHEPATMFGSTTASLVPQQPFGLRPSLGSLTSTASHQPVALRMEAKPKTRAAPKAAAGPETVATRGGCGTWNPI